MKRPRAFVPPCKLVFLCIPVLLSVPALALAVQFEPLSTCSEAQCCWESASLSADQQWILVEQNLGWEYYPTVHLRAPDGAVVVHVGNVLAASPVWSPAGDAIAFQALEWQGPLLGLGVQVQQVAWGMPPVLAPAQTIVDDPGAHHPRWSWDGNFLAYEHDNDGIWVVQASGLGATQVVAGGRHPSWGPDQQIVFDQGGDLWVRSTLGALRQLTQTPFGETMPAWSPQGDWIAFVSDEAGTSDIWLIPAGGGERRRLTTDKPQAFAPSWTADGSALVFTSGCQETATVWMATDLPSPTVAVERKAWGQLKQLFR